MSPVPQLKSWSNIDSCAAFDAIAKLSATPLPLVTE